MKVAMCEVARNKGLSLGVMAYVERFTKKIKGCPSWIATLNISVLVFDFYLELEGREEMKCK